MSGNETILYIHCFCLERRHLKTMNYTLNLRKKSCIFDFLQKCAEVFSTVSRKQCAFKSNWPQLQKEVTTVTVLVLKGSVKNAQ